MIQQWLCCESDFFFLLFLKRILTVWGLKCLFLLCLARCFSTGRHQKALKHKRLQRVWKLCCTCRRWACSLWLSCSLAPEQTSAQSQTSSRPCRGGMRSRRCTWPSTAHPPSGQLWPSRLWKSHKNGATLCLTPENAVTPALVHKIEQQNTRG